MVAKLLFLVPPPHLLPLHTSLLPLGVHPPLFHIPNDTQRNIGVCAFLLCRLACAGLLWAGGPARLSELTCLILAKVGKKVKKETAIPHSPPKLTFWENGKKKSEKRQCTVELFFFGIFDFHRFQPRFQPPDYGGGIRPFFFIFFWLVVSFYCEKDSIIILLYI